MRVVFIRLGESSMNRSNLIQSHTETLLTRQGEQQAEAVGERARARFDFDAVYASDTIRARRTAELMDLDPDIQTDDRIAPFDFGEVTGQELDEFLAENPEYHPDAEGAVDRAFPGGESTADLYDRVADFVDDLVEAHGPDETIAVLCHNTQVVAARAYAKGEDAAVVMGVEVPNCTGFIADYDEDGWMVIEELAFDD